MSRFAGVEPFVHVAEHLSFREAARVLGVSPTAVSKAVSRLEEQLGARLLLRTSRRVSLTPEGELYLEHCREALDRLKAGEDQVVRSTQVASGSVKLSVSAVLGRPVLTSLGRLLARHPRLQVHLSVSERTVSLVEEEVDVAVRVGALPDSSLVARRLRTTRWATVASPAYLARHPELRDWTDLEQHACLRFARPGGGFAEWSFQVDGEPVVFRGGGGVVIDQGDLLVDAALAGLGVIHAFDFMVEEHVRRGDLVEVLRHRSAEGPPIHALCLPGRRQVPKIDAVFRYLAEVVGGGAPAVEAAPPG